jgi:hypothetical protein
MQIPLRSAGNFPYIVGSVVLVGLTAALLLWNFNRSEAPGSITPAVTAVAEPPSRPAPVHAPPPPPPIEEEVPDAGADASVPRLLVPGSPAAQGPCATKCEGQSSASLNSALTGAAQSARSCYKRALRSSEVSGSMTVSVQVGSNGSICSASITNDTVRSNEIGSCVLGRFRGKMFPPPASGCVVVNIPISFTIKQ